MKKLFVLAVSALSLNSFAVGPKVSSYKCVSSKTRQVIVATPKYGEITVISPAGQVLRELDSMTASSKKLGVGTSVIRFVHEEGDTVLVINKGDLATTASFEGDRTYFCRPAR
jgi:hypothetical protein